MKSPFRKGVAPAISTAALTAAASIAARSYGALDEKSLSLRIVNFASAIVDEIEARQSASDKPQD